MILFRVRQYEQFIWSEACHEVTHYITYCVKCMTFTSNWAEVSLPSSCQTSATTLTVPSNSITIKMQSSFLIVSQQLDGGVAHTTVHQDPHARTCDYVQQHCIVRRTELLHASTYQWHATMTTANFESNFSDALSEWPTGLPHVSSRYSMITAMVSRS